MDSPVSNDRDVDCGASESLLSNAEKGWHPSKPSRQRLSHYLIPMTVLVLLLLALSGTWKLGRLSAELDMLRAKGKQVGWGDTVSKLWMPDDRFNPPSHTKDSDAAWDTITARYIGIEDPTKEGYPPSYLDPDYGNITSYAVSAFHQLHCLKVIRSAWWALLERGVGVLEDPTNVPEHPSIMPLIPHVAHCFDFLRQALICFADPTPEPYLMADGITIQPNGSSGWGVTHQCRDFNALSAWTTEHALYEDR